VDELPPLKPLTLEDIAARLRVPVSEVARWLDPGVKGPGGERVRLATLPPAWESPRVDPLDLVKFIRQRYGLPEPEFA
jgi:hypothetical protein